MKQELEISLKELFNNSLDTRESVSTLVKVIKEETQAFNEKDIVLNFHGIVFMSRSFADELHKMIMDDKFDVTVTFKGMNSDFLAMLKTVEKTQNKRSLNIKKASFVKIDDMHTLNNYAFSW
ncbi:STAS-like domain-containing protein [Parapedobacter sp. SGR-10]|uniref:STAS-like domain-containing protein n=1 Tax=Parapedobacter sp. SGR-10 TaxID=2710879 RepID=UPI0013D02692|nr:STAS-like domain-containing protein [Parapedobacter sp. SGR-10]NGF55391.1 STAS-like domain-containing protein [Parapedobacter sp. SGR-10]